ncbi:hypothetical protein AB0425_43140 [Actinosynnema sp. NPDC051121]
MTFTVAVKPPFHEFSDTDAVPGRAVAFRRARVQILKGWHYGGSGLRSNPSGENPR